MSLVIGALILFWALVGIAVFGFLFYNIFTKGHKPLQVLPVLLLLIVGFGYALVSTFYYANNVSQELFSNKTPNNATNSKSSSSSNNLYR
jgi:thiol:disulfide interchange protein